MRLFALLALLLALAGSASASTAAGIGHSGVLKGIVTRGPACSKTQLHPCSAPIPGVEIVFLRHGNPVARTTTDASGTYQMRLHAGRYGIQLPGRERSLPTHVRVRRTLVTRVNIAFDVLNG
jgi:hypothetical protein